MDGRKKLVKELRKTVGYNDDGLTGFFAEGYSEVPDFYYTVSDVPHGDVCSVQESEAPEKEEE